MISRVALFEASWLENFKGTAFVPNGEGWPGKSKDYNASYEYPLGTIDKEIEFFLKVNQVRLQSQTRHLQCLDHHELVLLIYYFV